jgi:CheY-like chemotaxis protein
MPYEERMDGGNAKKHKNESTLDNARGELAKAIAGANRNGARGESRDPSEHHPDDRDVEGKSSDRQKPVILIVDDDLILRKTLTRALKQEGFSPISTGDGQAAVDMCIRFRPAVVLLDLSMPNFNGPQVLKELRTRMGDCHPPVILITGSVTPDNLDRMGGAVACIGKPLRVSQIRELVDKCLTVTSTG